MRHKLRIAVAGRSGNTEVLSGSRKKMPKRLVNFLFGDFCEVMILSPGKTVKDIEIYEEKERELQYETLRSKRADH